MSGPDWKTYQAQTYTVSNTSDVQWGYGGHSDHIHINSQPIEFNGGMWEWPEQNSLTFECLVCGHEGDSQICELCRQAILMFRQKVLEQMARDLAEMEEDI